MLRVLAPGNATYTAAELTAIQLYLQRREVSRGTTWSNDARNSAAIEYLIGLWWVAIGQISTVGTASMLPIARNLATQLRNRGFTMPVGYWSAVSAVVADGGSATYVVGETMSVSGGTKQAAATFSIATLSTGTIATVTLVNAGVYYRVPSNDAAITGGSGGGSPTLTITWQFNPTSYNV